MFPRTSFIVIGTGFFKTSASVTVGMLYKQNDTRCDTGYTIFYIGINIGAFIAPLICGFVQAKWNYHFRICHRRFRYANLFAYFIF
ncbi:TPA_asm: peptide transporter [Campylobacter jejuni]|nr:peptide transporter [Campylobacter jejuni]HAA1595197.1 peptide transporter [Campylobacter jejuni]HAA1635233.1 peptide transporter [Campylobacter jejuni]HAA1644072.1 peptide transporter [Campylobacter jejuni]HAA1724934.1 peptide transporter [Campylobacter jejuni]